MDFHRGDAEYIVQRPKVKWNAKSGMCGLVFTFNRVDLSLVPTSRLNELVGFWMERVDAKIIRDFGKTRMDRFLEESMHLNPIPQGHFEHRLPEPLVVSREGRILFQTNHYSIPATYRGKQLEGMLDPCDNMLQLKYEGTIVKTIKLAPAGMKKTFDDPADRKEHLDAWLEGFKMEEKIRHQVFDKRKRAEQETETVHPAIFDRLFEEGLRMEVLVASRYKKSSIILTTNKTFGQWGELMDDNVIATTTLDRLLHHADVVIMKGESYCIKKRSKLGLLPLSMLSSEKENRK